VNGFLICDIGLLFATMRGQHSYRVSIRVALIAMLGSGCWVGSDPPDSVEPETITMQGYPSAVTAFGDCVYAVLITPPQDGGGPKGAVWRFAPGH